SGQATIHKVDTADISIDRVGHLVAEKGEDIDGREPVAPYLHGTHALNPERRSASGFDAVAFDPYRGGGREAEASQFALRRVDDGQNRSVAQHDAGLRSREPRVVRQPAVVAQEAARELGIAAVRDEDAAD